jgi:transcription initiation factor TFIIIB Brf1 subunit/transcription initiation factor TFIIB
MPISDTYKKLVREAFKDMSPSEQQDFISWAMELFLRRKIKESNETKTINEMETSTKNDGLP